MRHRSTLAALLAVVLTTGCSMLPPVSTSPASAPSSRAPAAGDRRADPRDVARLSRLMVPLLQAANRPRPLDRIGVAIVDDPEINAANAGGGRFYVTRGLLARASDEQLQAVLAHEVAHDDLGHVAKAQALAAGVGLGAAILEEVFPGTGQIAPLAGTLITRAYSRSEELAADRHGTELLRRVGAPPETLERTLLWLRTISGGGEGGGFFATHPGLEQRIEALRRLR